MSAEEGNAKGLSLEGLAQSLEAQAQKLETLEQENERMRSENGELRSKVATLEGSGIRRAVEEQEPAASSSQRRVSRSWLLRNAGAAAVGTMAAGALLARDASVAKANHFNPGISVDYVITHLETAGLTAVFGDAPNGEGVVGFGKTHGVRGEGQTGVLGKTSATGFAGVSGLNTGSGYGVVGDGSGNGSAGVLGRHSGNGWGVRGEGGVLRQNSKNGVASVHGEHTGTAGYGVAGRGTLAGVRGQGSEYGGQFEGGLAQLKLTPKGTVGKPTSGAHTKGEIYLDSAGTLFVCTANGTPGTWRKVTTTAA